MLLFFCVPPRLVDDFRGETTFLELSSAETDSLPQESEEFFAPLMCPLLHQGEQLAPMFPCFGNAPFKGRDGRRIHLLEKWLPSPVFGFVQRQKLSDSELDFGLTEPEDAIRRDSALVAQEKKSKRRASTQAPPQSDKRVAPKIHCVAAKHTVIFALTVELDKRHRAFIQSPQQFFYFGIAYGLIEEEWFGLPSKVLETHGSSSSRWEPERFRFN